MARRWQKDPFFSGAKRFGSYAPETDLIKKETSYFHSTKTVT